MKNWILIAALLVSSIASADTPGPVTILNMRSGDCVGGFLRGGSMLTCSTLVSSDIPNNAANTSGTSANITAASNSSLTTLPNLSLPYSQVTGGPTPLTFGNFTASAPFSISGSPTGAVVGSGFSIGVASGYYFPTTSDEANWNAKQSALTFGNVTASSPFSLTGGTGAVVGSGVSLGVSSGYYFPTSTDEANWNAKQNALGFTPENISNKSVANGYAGLDSSGKVPLALLPSVVMEYQGAWNATTNSPALSNSGCTDDTNGDVYRVSTGGTQNLGAGSITFQVGDFVVCSSAVSQWQDSPAADGVTSVNGMQGAVTVSSVPSFSGSLVGDVIGTQTATSVIKVNGASLPSSSSLVGTNSSGQIIAQTGIISNSTSGNAATATALAALPSGCTGNNFSTGIATSGNASCAQPAFSNLSGTASLTSQVTGILGVANGGTGANSLTLNDVLLGNGTSTPQQVAPGSSGAFLRSNATTWQSSAIQAGDLPSGTVSGTGVSGYIPYFNATSGIADSSMFLSGGNIGVGTTSPIAHVQIGGNVSSSAWGTGGISLGDAAATFTDTSSSGTVANNVHQSLGIPTYAASSATTYTNAINRYTAGTPAAGTNATFTNSIADYIAGSATSGTNSYGLYVSASSGATNNYAATFMGGRVGIGTTTPSYTLDVEASTTATMSVTGGSGSAAIVEVLGTGTSGTGVVYIDGASNEWQILAHQGGTQLSFSPTNNVNTYTPTMTLSGANVGIGTTSPAQTLDVNGLIRIKPQGSGVTPTCSSTVNGSMAFTSAYILCVCNGSTWVQTSNGSTACTF